MGFNPVGSAYNGDVTKEELIGRKIKDVYDDETIILEEEIDSSTESKKGFGNCEDCGWHGNKEGCNVERGSKLCVLNRMILV